MLCMCVLIVISGHFISVATWTPEHLCGGRGMLRGQNHSTKHERKEIKDCHLVVMLGNYLWALCDINCSECQLDGGQNVG